MSRFLEILRGADGIEDYLRSAIEEFAGGIAIIDSDGIIRYVNSALAAMHGYYTTEELAGKRLEALHNEEQMRDDVMPLMEEMKFRGQIAGPVEHARSDGTTFPTQTKIVRITDSNGEYRGVVLFVTGEDECRFAEQSFARSNIRLANANERLQLQVYELEQGQALLKKQVSELNAENEQLRTELSATKEQIRLPEGVCGRKDARPEGDMGDKQAEAVSEVHKGACSGRRKRKRMYKKPRNTGVPLDKEQLGKIAEISKRLA